MVVVVTVGEVVGVGLALLARALLGLLRTRESCRFHVRFRASGLAALQWGGAVWGAPRRDALAKTQMSL